MGKISSSETARALIKQTRYQSYYLKERTPALKRKLFSGLLPISAVDKAIGPESAKEKTKLQALLDRQNKRDRAWDTQHITRYQGGAVTSSQYTTSQQSNGLRKTCYTTKDGVNVEVIETPHNSGLTREIKATNCFLLPHNFRSATGSIKLEKINQTLHNSYDSPGQKSASSLVNGHAVPNSWGVGESTLATRIGSPISNMFNQQQRTETERIRRELTAKGFTENGPRGKTFSVYTRQEEALPTDEELRTIIRENFPTLNATLPAYRLRARLACILNTKVTRVRNYHLEARDNTGKIIGEINLPAGDIWFLQKNSWTQNKITPEANRAISLAEKIQKGLEAEQKLAKNPLTLADIMSMS